MSKIIKIPSVYVIDTKVAGVSHTNSDGTSRQLIITQEVREGDTLSLLPEPDNAYDQDAVRVMTTSGKQIGYLNKEVAPQVLSAILNEATVITKASWVSEREIKGVGLRIELVS